MPVVVRNTIEFQGMSTGRHISASLLCVLMLFSAANAQQANSGIPREDVPANCLQAVLAEQQLTRSLREIREPLPHLSRDEAIQVRRDYNKLLYNGFTGEADTKTVRTYLEYLILRASDPDFSSIPSNGQQLLKDVESDLQRAGSSVGNPSTQLTMRRKFCGEMLTTAKKLLTNSLDARIIAVSVMKFLHESKAVPGGAAARLYPEALASLIDVLASAEQPDSVKVFAASGLRYVLRNCDVIETEQFRICDAIGMELERPCTQAAFQLTLLEALMEISRPRKTVGGSEPTAMKSFVDVLNDRSRPIEVRCMAALGIGRGSFDTQMKLQPLAWKIAQLAGDAALEFNRNTGDDKWPSCGAALIFAFSHYSNNETGGSLTERKGLLNRAGNSPPAAITDAAPLVRMVGIKLIQNSEGFTGNEVQPLAAWIQENKPANLKWDNTQPALNAN